MSIRLRGKGPQVFISYSFGNELAPKLARELTSQGFQVNLVADSALLGEPSLHGALERLICQSEVVVPVLDRKANQSQWVNRELDLAKTHKKLLFPIVLDKASLPAVVQDIPYVTEDSIAALVPGILSRYALLPLDPERPYLLSHNALRSYLSSSSPVTRVIIDTDHLTGRIIDEIPQAVESATRKQPELRQIIEQQVRDSIDSLPGVLDLLEPVLPTFRLAVATTLKKWGPRVVEQSLPAWDRLIRMVIGIPIVRVAMTLHPKFNPDYWGVATTGLLEALAQVKAVEKPHHSYGQVDWALTLPDQESSEAWVSAVFLTSQRKYVRCFLPKVGDIVELLRIGEAPQAVIEPETWAWYGLPQLFGNAVYMAEDSGRQLREEDLLWDMAKYGRVSLG